MLYEPIVVSVQKAKYRDNMAQSIQGITLAG